MTQNPNWPLIDEAVSFPAGPTSAQPAPYWVSMIERSRQSWSTTTGRQYELDDAQTGTVTTVFQNKDGALDPSNTASIFYPMVQSYRGYRRRAQYPATINILAADQATAGAAAGTYGVTAPAVGTLPPLVSAGGIYAVSTTAAHVYSTTLPVSPVNGTHLSEITGWSVLGGAAFAAQARVTASVSTSLKLAIVWIDATGATISTTTGTPATVTTAQVITVTGTAPANAAGAIVTLVLNSSPGSSSTVTSVNWQVERGSSASAYVQPSLWYPLFAGFVERWPLTWNANGLYGLSNVTVVDVFGWLSQRFLHSPAYMELLALGPNFLYCLDEPQDSTLFYDAAGLRPPMPLLWMAGAPDPALFSAGNQLQSPSTAAGVGGPVVTFSPGGGLVAGVLNLGATQIAGAIGPSTSAAWTRIFAFRTTSVAMGGQIWGTLGKDASGFNGYGVQTGGDVLTCYVAGLAGFFFVSSPNVITDGLWHLGAMSMAADGKTMKGWLDGISIGTATNATDMRLANCQGDYIGAQVFEPNSVDGAFPGDVVMAAELPFVITPAQMTLLYNTFLHGGQPDSTGRFTTATRYADVLRWASYTGPVAIDNYSSGETIDYGPPADLYATRDSQGTSVVTALQNVMTTENGIHFPDASGVIQARARRARYNLPTPVIVFGERVDLGEIPYTGNVAFGYDPTRVANDASITQTSTNAVFRYQDAASQAVYGDIPLSRNVNSLSSYELSDAAQFLVAKGKRMELRLQSIHINVGSQPTAAVWQAMMTAVQGLRVRVMRRPPAPAPAMQFEGFIEQINWTMVGPDAGVDLQISPYSSQQFWALASSHVTVKNAITPVGQQTLVINPLPDSAINPVQANISAKGDLYAWIIDAGTASAELITVIGVTANAPGYTSATLTIGQCQRLDTGATGTGFRFTHAIGAVVQDLGGLTQQSGWPGAAASIPLLAITAAPGAYDALSTLGSTTIAGY